MISILNHSSDCWTEAQTEGPVLRIGDEWIILCKDSGTAEDIKDQLSKPINSNLESVDYTPGDTSKNPWHVGIGPHLIKAIRIEDYYGTEEINIHGNGLNSNDVKILEEGRFTYQFKEYEERHWHKRREYSHDDRFFNLVERFEIISG